MNGPAKLGGPSAPRAAAPARRDRHRHPRWRRSGSFAPVDPDLAAMVVLGGVRMAADSGSDDPAEAVAALLLGGLVHRAPTSQDLQR